jgi:WhiB family redox-sensing transcriptional regulator
MVATQREDGWMARAACREADVELFYSEEPTDQDEALALCARCEVRTQCYERAMADREAFGIWGGSMEHERRRAFRQQRQAAQGYRGSTAA